MSTQPYKILVLIKGLNLGGAERLLVDALPYLNRDQFEYHFAYLLAWSNFLVPRFQAAGFPVHCLGMQKNYHFPMMPPRLHTLQRQHRFDLIHADLPLPGIMARMIGRWHKIPVVYTEHNVIDRLHPVSYWANRLTYGWNSQVLAVSQGVFNSISQLGLERKTRVQILRNGVPVEQVRDEAHQVADLRQEFDIPREHLVVGTVAVFTRQKRLQDWLRVARQVAHQRQDVTFLLAGYGPEEAALKAQVKALGLADRVRMPGFRADGRRVLGLLDVYLMTSEFEGLPMALLEALALARPVVATAVGGIPEVVSSNQEGFLAQVGAVDALAAFTLQLLSDPALRTQMGQRGAARVENDFHMKTRVGCIEAIYLRLLQSSNDHTKSISNN